MRLSAFAQRSIFTPLLICLQKTTREDDFDRSSSFVYHSAVLAELFADGPYRLQMRFERGSIAEFYRATSDAASVLAERQRWIRQTPALCLAEGPAAQPLLDEACGLLGLASGLNCAELGARLEPDFLLMRPDPIGNFRLTAGCVCFPSSWDLREKIGRELDFIHAPVPGLNASLGTQIQGFLQRIRPDISWNRTNWGLSRSPEFNQHPERNLPRLDASVSLADVFLRIEYQSLAALPATGGVLFGIRIAVHSLPEVLADAQAAQGLARALETMPEDLARYKGLATARGRIVDLLRAGAT
jgi:dimethylamine monooxygenase subunit A